MAHGDRGEDGWVAVEAADKAVRSEPWFPEAAAGRASYRLCSRPAAIFSHLAGAFCSSGLQGLLAPSWIPPLSPGQSSSWLAAADPWTLLSAVPGQQIQVTVHSLWPEASACPLLVLST